MSNELVQEYEYRIGEERANVAILCSLGFVLMLASSLILESKYVHWLDYVSAVFVLLFGGIIIRLVLHTRVKRAVKVFQDRILIPKAPFYKIQEEIFFSDIKDVSLEELFSQGIFLVIEKNDFRKIYINYRFMSRKNFCELLHYLEARAGLTQSEDITPQWFIECFRSRISLKILVLIIVTVILDAGFLMGFHKATIKEVMYYASWIGFTLYVLSCLTEREMHSEYHV